MEGEVMQRHKSENWKRALMIGSFGAAAFLFLTGRRAAGFALAGVGVATLAGEYPEKFEKFWNAAPEYLDRGTRLVQGVGNFVEKIAEQSSRLQEHARQTRPDYIT
jgi:hypothetical protein